MAKRKGINIIDPADVPVNQEDLQMYVELIGVRRSESVLVGKYYGNIDNSNFVFDDKVVRFNAISDRNVYTTDWTDFERGDKELFGITDISIKQTEGFSMKVDVTFVDIRGYGLFSVGAVVDNEDQRLVQYTSPYSILYDVPAAFFKLKIKGYYGKSITINLMLSPKPPTISYDSSTGNYKVNASFVSWTFGVLRDFKMQYLMYSPFLAERLNGAGFDGDEIILDSKNSKVTSILGLIEKSKELNRVIDNFKNDEKLSKFENVSSKVSLYETIRVKYLDLIKYLSDNRLSYEVSEDNLNVLTNSSNNLNKFNSDILRRVKDIDFFNNLNKLELPNLSAVFNDNVTINSGLLSGTSSSGIIIVNGGNVFTQNFNILSNKIQNEYKKLGQELNDSLENEVKKTLGFIPTIGNIVKIICNDADRFISLFKDMLIRAEQNHTSNIISAPKEGDTLNDEKTPFPVFIERVSYPDLDSNTNGTPIFNEVLAYPGSNPLYKSWPECQFIEAYLSINTKIIDDSNSSKQNINFENTENNKPTFIPSTTLETIYPYKNITNLDLLFNKIIDRYLYIKGFVYGKTKNEDLEKFIAGIEAYNLSRNLTKDNQLYQALIDYYNKNKINLINTIRNNASNLPQTNSLLNNTSIKITNGQYVKDASVFNGANKFQSIKIEKNGKPVKLFTGIGDEVYDKLLTNITNNTPWISILLNGKGGSFNKNGKPSVVVSSNGYLLVPDYKFRSDNSSSDYKKDVILLNGNLNDTLNTATLSNFDKFKFVSQTYFNSIPVDFFSLPCIYELPILSLYQIDLTDNSELSFNDKEYLIEALETYANDNINRLVEFANSSGFTINDFYKNFNDRVLFTVGSYYSLKGEFEDYNLNESTEIQPYLNLFMELLQTNVNNKPQPLPVKSNNIDSKIDSDELKLRLYTDFQSLYKRWFSADGLDFFDNQSLYNYFIFEDRAGRDISNKLIVNFDNMIKSIEKNPNANFLDIVFTLLKDNGFITYQFESLIKFDSDGDENFNYNLLFGTNLAVESKNLPSIKSVYIGGNSSKLNIPSTNKKNDSFNICEGDIPVDFKDGNVNIFVVNITDQNQKIFTNIKVDTDSFTRNIHFFDAQTAIAKNGETPSKAQRIGQSILSPYQLASFTITVTAMGNASIQPGMYFCLKGVNFFDGTYLVKDVSHDINYKGMVTNFSGIRVPRYPLPLVQTYFASFVKTFVSPNIEIPSFIVDNNPNKGLVQNNTSNPLPVTGNSASDSIDKIDDVEITSSQSEVKIIAKGEIVRINTTQLSDNAPNYTFKGDGEFVLVYHGLIESGEFNGRHLYSQYSYLSKLDNLSLRNVNINDVIGKTGNSGENSLKEQNRFAVSLKFFVSDLPDSIEITSDNRIKNNTVLISREQFNNVYKLTDKYRIGS